MGKNLKKIMGKNWKKNKIFKKINKKGKEANLTADATKDRFFCKVFLGVVADSGTKAFGSGTNNNTSDSIFSKN